MLKYIKNIPWAVIFSVMVVAVVIGFSLLSIGSIITSCNANINTFKVGDKVSIVNSEITGTVIHCGASIEIMTDGQMPLLLKNLSAADLEKLNNK